MKTFRIDAAARLVIVDFAGVVTLSDLRAGLDEYNQTDPQYSFLIDLTAVEEFRVASEGIRLIAKGCCSGARKCAVIAPTAVAFGLARMYEAHADNCVVAVFRDAAAARQWLGGGTVSGSGKADAVSAC